MSDEQPGELHAEAYRRGLKLDNTQSPDLVERLDERDLHNLRVLFKKTDGKSWEPPQPNYPWLVRMIDAGFLKRCTMRCGFEAFDGGMTWTEAGRMALAEPTADEIERLRTISPEMTALNAYRAAASFIGADAWDGCSDCMEILRAARMLDAEWDWAGDPNRIAVELRKVRVAASLPSTEPLPGDLGVRAVKLLETAVIAGEYWLLDSPEMIEAVPSRKARLTLCLPLRRAIEARAALSIPRYPEDREGVGDPLRGQPAGQASPGAASASPPFGDHQAQGGE